MGHPVLPVEAGDTPADSVAAAAVNTTGSAFFTQLLDHNDPSKGTFQQKYWWNSEWWAGPGSPVVIFTPGETAAGPYGIFLTNITLPGIFAQEIKGAIILIEHRYWGESSPYTNLDAETLQLLTLEQAIGDFTHFAKTVALPFDTAHSSNADKAPWVWSGASYSGALAAWIESTAPGTFWAYHASSAPVEAIYDYWQYSSPILEGMPKNCSSDISKVIEYMDGVFQKGTAAEQLALKTMFGLESVEHNDDVMRVLRSGVFSWQDNSFTSGYSVFYQFCDSIENVEAGAAVTPDVNGIGLTKALAGYAKFVNETIIPGYCSDLGYTDERETKCMDSYDPTNPVYTNHTVDNVVNLQWIWMLCNEPFGYWQSGAPLHETTIISRLITGDYWQKQCSLFFPTVNGFTYRSNASPDNNVHQVNKYTKGWRLEDTTRLIWTNGQFDPWKAASMSSEYREGGPFPGSATAPLQIIPGGFHGSDFGLWEAKANAGVQNVVDNEVAQIVKWVAEYYKK
ncbi:peptidase S28 [Rhexocercosporidium sp. MPI-PUGE-AT-0058]|nr:peptidase S28 [Rhexocercosporidium sp. MPI-PUGE-AT-0058]